MAKCKLVVEIKYNWYVRKIYLPSLILFESICNYIGVGTNPDFDLISKTIVKNSSIKIKVK